MTVFDDFAEGPFDRAFLNRTQTLLGKRCCYGIQNRGRRMESEWDYSNIPAAKQKLKKIQDDIRDQRKDLDSILKVNGQFERAHAKKVATAAEEHSAKIEIANRRIRAAVRCDALLVAHPKVAVLGPPAIFLRALKEDLKAKNNPRANFKVEQPDSYIPDGDPEPVPPRPR